MSGFQGWTTQKVVKLHKEGKIKGYVLPISKEEKKPAGRIVVKHFRKRSKEKDWISWNLVIWSLENKQKLMEEFQFDETGVKKYRFDWCLPDLKIAIEYEGLMSEKSGHTTVTGYTKDVLKYNLAQAQGWQVIRLTALSYLTMLIELNKLAKI